MTPRAALSRSLGWMASAASAAALLSGMAFALAAQRDAAPAALMLDLSQQPPAAPAVAAVSDAAPQAMDEAPDLPDQPAPLAEAAPDAPRPDTAPDLPPARPALSLPEPEVPARADLSAPPPPKEEPPEKIAKAEPQPKPKPKPEKPAKPKPEQTAAKPKKETAEASSKPAAAAAGAAAPKAAEKATGAPKVSAASYAKSVMKKVRGTKKKKAAGRGSVTVGFTVAKDGGLASVKVLNSSGNADLDRIALDHIRRAAPFPPPPEGVGRNFSFEFVGK
jgi:protein TonB